MSSPELGRSRGQKLDPNLGWGHRRELGRVVGEVEHHVLGLGLELGLKASPVSGGEV